MSDLVRTNGHISNVGKDIGWKLAFLRVHMDSE